MSLSRLVLKENGLLYARRINQERSNVKDYPIKGSSDSRSEGEGIGRFVIEELYRRFCLF
ncbi:hypothetical protein N7505_001453 [Penicillium chrysogenum]|uniref:Uncharacterized protein n=1 Tax=Penicillium chrysogenum TaxID=5076 RepID=A0ABQ8WX27_PENCH|nr:hypothetical protein N7505_001453 [Penicillium chrysogenum]